MSLDDIEIEEVNVVWVEPSEDSKNRWNVDGLYEITFTFSRFDKPLMIEVFPKNAEYDDKMADIEEPLIIRCIGSPTHNLLGDEELMNWAAVAAAITDERVLRD